MRYQHKELIMIDDVPVSRHDVIVNPMTDVMVNAMTALFFQTPRPLKHRIQNKHYVICEISSWDVGQLCHDDVTVSRHDITVHDCFSSIKIIDP